MNPSHITQTIYVLIIIFVLAVYFRLLLYTIKMDRKIQSKRLLNLNKTSLPSTTLMKNLTEIILKESDKTRLELFETAQFQHFYKKFKGQQDTIIRKMFYFEWNA